MDLEEDVELDVIGKQVEVETRMSYVDDERERTEHRTPGGRRGTDEEVEEVMNCL